MAHVTLFRIHTPLTLTCHFSGVCFSFLSGPSGPAKAPSGPMTRNDTRRRWRCAYKAAKYLLFLHRKMIWATLAVFSCLTTLQTASARAPAGPWDNFNYVPSSKTVYPTAIHSTNGTISNASNLIANKGKATITGNHSWVALDFGKEVSIHSASSLDVAHEARLGRRSHLPQS